MELIIDVYNRTSAESRHSDKHKDMQKNCYLEQKFFLTTDSLQQAVIDN